jgi:hypothetical protein
VQEFISKCHNTVFTTERVHCPAAVLPQPPHCYIYTFHTLLQTRFCPRPKPLAALSCPTKLFISFLPHTRNVSLSHLPSTTTTSHKFRTLVEMRACNALALLRVDEV